jgi:PAS domain S-box-containing protein
MKRTREGEAPAVHEHQRMIHELEIHKIELEMQNQALREDREQLEKSRARYAELYDFAPVGHLTLDISGTITELNFACAELLGKTRGSAHSRPLRAFVAPQSREALDAHVRACGASDAPLVVELVVPVTGGGFRAVELVSARAPDGAKGSTAVHSVMTDVSDRKRDNERRDQLLRHEREARIVAEEVNRAKEDFLAVVSHELRTPLVPMIMWIKALRAGGMNDTLRQRAVEAIDTCLQVEVAMIDDLVDVARGQHGKLRVQQVPVDLQPITAAAIEAIAPSAANKRIELKLSVDPEPVWVAGDPMRLRQIVTNLLSNAVKFTREAGHVDVSLHTVGQEVVLTVRDDGEGIEESLLGDIFQPFRQHGMGTARRHGGLGLGLAIVHQLVGQHHGFVIAESEGKDRGACFTVTLPRGESPRGVLLRTDERGAMGPQGRGELAGIQVLVVEDHPATREALEAALHTQGAVVMAAASAAEARAAIARARPQVVLSDIGMPEEDGYAFVRGLRAAETAGGGLRLPVVALTAHTTESDRELALAAGFDGHIPKPVDFDRLFSMVGALARSHAPLPAA